MQLKLRTLNYLLLKTILRGQPLLTVRAIWLNPPQCLLQQCADFVIAAFAFLVQFHKEVGGGLQSLVYRARVFAVCGEFLQAAYQAVKEGEGLAVYIIKAYILTLLCHLTIIYF